jgi:predicted ATPase
LQKYFFNKKYMLTRLKISGFKNLVGVDIYFGPFTCIAGSNGIGKSNVFDAILFLSALAEMPIMNAAMSVRDEKGKFTDVKSLFHRVGVLADEKISLQTEMIVPENNIDDLGQEAKAGITFLRYTVELKYVSQRGLGSQGFIELTKEELSHIKIGDASKHVLFRHSKPWLKSVVKGRRSAPLISTETSSQGVRIKLHQDRGESGGIPRVFLAKNLPRTVLSTANAAESRTTLAAKREMQSWRLLLLEPSALRRPDSFTAPAILGPDGSHLPATLYKLAKSGNGDDEDREKAEAQVYSGLANRLSELIDDVYEIRIDRDEKRELLTLEVTDRDGTVFSARDLSDGTLRFLAAAVIERDSESQGLLCLEEPENGIHPSRIPSMLKLLQDIATDVDEAIGMENPLRQVIVNTHSPAVVAQIPDDCLLVAESKEVIIDELRFKTARFSCLNNTWRARKQGGVGIVSRGDLLSYLNPLSPAETEKEEKSSKKDRLTPRRVIDRSDLQELLPFVNKEK